MSQLNRSKAQADEYPYGKWQFVLRGIQWPPFGFRLMPRTWGLYLVYHWTLWLPGLEIRRWVGTSEFNDRIRVHQDASKGK